MSTNRLCHDNLLETTLDLVRRYVNQRCHVVRVDEHDNENDLRAKAQIVERYLWDHRDLLTHYVQENPDGLSQEQLSVAAGFADALYATFHLVLKDDGTAVLYHETGAYRVPLDVTGEKEPPYGMPLTVRCAIVPFEIAIRLTSHPIVTGPTDSKRFQQLCDQLERQGLAEPVNAAQELARRSRAWNATHPTVDGGARLPQPSPAGPGFHRGRLAGLAGTRRLQARQAHYDQSAWSTEGFQAAMAARSIDTHAFPTTLEEGLRLLDDDWLGDIASQLSDTAISPALPRDQLISWICAELRHDCDQRDLALMWCEDEQFELVRRLMDANPLSLTSLPPTTVSHLYPMVPFVFVLHEMSTFVAWMPPEVHALMARADLDAIADARQQIALAASAARALATTCGIISLADAYERYREVVDQPLDRDRFETVLTELEDSALRDDYALWRHHGTTYLVSVELSDASAMARVVQECYQSHVLFSNGGDPHLPTVVSIGDQDEDEFSRRVTEKEAQLEQMRVSLLRAQGGCTPHALDPDLLGVRPINGLMERDALRKLRDFVDLHVPDDQNDYEFPDRFTRSVVVSTTLMHDSYDEVLDIIRLYGMLACEGTDVSDTLGRLVTNAFNALPQWPLGGYSLEENTERMTGRRRFYHMDGTPLLPADDDPCPCGSNKPYGSCCGNLACA